MPGAAREGCAGIHFTSGRPREVRRRFGRIGDRALSTGEPQHPETSREPLLSGAAAAAARDAVEAIVADLAPLMAAEWPRDAEAPAVSPLAGGPAGIALFFAYAHLTFPGRGLDDLCLAGIQQALAMVSSTHLMPSLFSGFTGVGWMLRHLEGRIFEAEEDLGAEVESTLLQALARYPKLWPSELIAGLSGFGLYFLERLPGEPARRGTEQIIDQLAATATAEDGAITWFTPGRGVPPTMREIAPNGYYNMSLSHGLPGVIGFLAVAHRLGVAAGEARRLADGTVRWLLAQRLPAGSSGVFPAYIGPGIAPAPTRLAWCYGDPGVAAALLLAARSFGREDWEREALAAARHAAGRREGELGVEDAGLCHGAAGLAHVFHRLFRATGDETLREAALFWLQRTLEMRQPGLGPGGFRRADYDAADQRIWTADSGFLTGAAGIGLALLAAISPVEPEWDRLLLLR
ncbi:MAG TPA: lanthionine synthetase C family protein [Thermoanaerobaculia bacterium]|nr:lanthionine synthetase C family protein [Thermoanaerobaculia bacterium]